MGELMPAYPRDGLSILRPDGATEAALEGRRKNLHVGSGKWEVGSGKSEVGSGKWEVRSDKSEVRSESSVPSSQFSVLSSIGLDGGRSEALGSNNWVVDGTMTASGKPLLANDPHLSTHVPSTWYLAHVSAPDFDVIGATLPGAPAIALGRNRTIAWGATNVAADVQDLYREQIRAEGKSAAFHGRSEPLTIIPEDIIVKGAPPTHVEVRITRHGPLVS